MDERNSASSIKPPDAGRSRQDAETALVQMPFINASRRKIQTMQNLYRPKKLFMAVALIAAFAILGVGSVAMAAYPDDPDLSEPSVTSVVPANGSTIYSNGSSTIYYQSGNTTPTVIRADYTDEAGGSGVDPASVMVHLDGGNMLSDCPVQTVSHVDCNATAADLFPGTHPLDVYVMDYAGNLTVNHTTLIVVVDDQAPTYSNLLPAAGSTLYTSQLNSTSTNDPSALRFDYDLTDAAPSSGYSPMSHINDSVPPGVAGAMIMQGCNKTPTSTNPTHYSCQANRAKLLHLGDNTLSVLLKDKVGNTSSNYTDPSSLNHYTVVDDVAPTVSGVTANSTTITAAYSDPLPTGALSTLLASGINAGTAMIHVDGNMIMNGCTVTAAGISCPTPAGLAVGTHSIEAMVTDNSGNTGMATGSLTVDPPPCTVGKPSLSLAAPVASWGTYANYTARKLSVTWTVNNTGSTNASSVQLESSNSTYAPITTVTAMPAAVGDIAGGGSGSVVVQYQLPTGTPITGSGFHVVNTASANDCGGNSYAYPS